MATTRSGAGGGDSNVRQRKTKASASTEKPPAPQVEEVDTDEAEEIERERKEAETKREKKEKKKKKKRTPAEQLDEEDDYTPWVDILRVITFLIFASCALSYLISGGESFTWGMKHKPKYLRAKWWKAKFTGPIYLTPAELAEYDGRDEAKPLYLAINGTIYDVSENRRTYGPEGSYRYFAGVDAARGYVTGCFEEDRTADMRGVEEMYLPLDDPEVDSHWSPKELAALKIKEREDALRRVRNSLAHWVNFFRDSPRYPMVGYVKRPKNWLAAEPIRPLCQAAAKARTTRKIPEN